MWVFVRECVCANPHIYNRLSIFTVLGWLNLCIWNRGYQGSFYIKVLYSGIRRGFGTNPEEVTPRYYVYLFTNKQYYPKTVFSQ